MTSFHPDFYQRMYRHCDERTALVAQLAKFLSHTAIAEPLGYPRVAKMHHQARWPFSRPIRRGFSPAMRGKAFGTGCSVRHFATGSAYCRTWISGAGTAARAQGWTHG
jgi:4-hydroxy-tetrahydrodipicolinate synthase